MESATIMDLVLPRAGGVLGSEVLAHHPCLCPMLEGKEDASLLAALRPCSPQPSPVLVQDHRRSLSQKEIPAASAPLRNESERSRNLFSSHIWIIGKRVAIF